MLLLIAAIGLAVVPIAEPASAATYDTFEIENYTVMNQLTLKSAVQPDKDGWGPPPPALVSSGERRHFGIGRWYGRFDRATIIYTVSSMGVDYGTVQFNTYRSPAGDFSTCVYSSTEVSCRVVPATNGSNTKFVIEDRYDENWYFDSYLAPVAWAQTLSALCLRPSLATCKGPGVGPGPINWSGVIGDQMISFDYIIWKKGREFSGGLRGNPYNEEVYSPLAMRPYGFTTRVTGLPLGLAYYPEYDKILGTPVGLPGTSVVSFSLVYNNSTVVSTTTKTITITGTPAIVVKP